MLLVPDSLSRTGRKGPQGQSNRMLVRFLSPLRGGHASQGTVAPRLLCDSSSLASPDLVSPSKGGRKVGLIIFSFGGTSFGRSQEVRVFIASVVGNRYLALPSFFVVALFFLPLCMYIFFIVYHRTFLPPFFSLS